MDYTKAEYEGYLDQDPSKVNQETQLSDEEEYKIFDDLIPKI